MIDRILHLTAEVAALAERGSWAEAAELDRERQRELRAYCAGLDPQSASPELIQALTQILQLNDRLVGSLEHRQRGLLREADTVRTGQRAVAAYQATGRF